MNERAWRMTPRALIWIAQIAIFAASGVTALLVRFEFSLADIQLIRAEMALPVWIAGKAIAFRAFQLDRGWWSHSSVPDMVRLGVGNLAGSVISAAVIMYLSAGTFPRSVLVLDLLICAHLTAGARLIARVLRDRTAREPAHNRKRVVIYGAGDAGVMLLRELRSNPRLAYQVRGFVDDDRRKAGMRVQGVPVLGTGAELAEVRQKHGIEKVLIAIPSADGSDMTRILGHCHAAGLRCKTVPGLGDFLENRAVAPQIRDLNLEDLLGRKPVRLDQAAVAAKIEDQVVMVTGAAGSIGSEICRQIARFRPRKIVALDTAETPLFYLAEEMRAKFPGVVFHPEIGNIQNARDVIDVIQHYGPSRLFHAAAYKHVPMMESAMFSAVENNILGTANVAEAAAEGGVADFVMISSDKAVRPANLMGLTKRAAELLIGSMQNGSTKYASVRFGNVLGSNGSVIPIFRKQIAEGGPVTVTHPEMRRYFMTIPEAVQLVLQASTMSKGGEIFVLDMGQPVKILDLARNLILLSGLRPDQDIRIEFTGVRPGEKLYEELRTLEENTLPTYHEKIRILEGPTVPPEAMSKRLATLRRLCAARDKRHLILELKDLVPEYNPSMHVLQQLVEQAAPVQVAPMRAKAAGISGR
jgi:FlaA1/EpsC-like NDP-sugar epimerase